MKKEYKKVILATGGTGGHIFPAIALSAALKKAGINSLITADIKFSKFHNFDDSHILIPSANFVDKSPIGILRTLFTLAKGFLKALWLFLNYKPDLVIGFGGYASYPTMVVAALLQKDIVLHEANTVIGKVNKVLLPWAKYLTTGFKDIKGIPEKYKSKIFYTGNPVREEILVAAKAKKQLPKNKFSILIIGGSQGAKVFSKMIPDAIINLPTKIKKNLFIHQQVKEEDIGLIKDKYANEHIDYEIKSFFNDMNEKLKSVNLVIARAGASTISELIEFTVPGIFIPYPSAADNHQYYNAKAIADIKGGWLVNESKESHLQILQIIKSIEQNPAIIEEYAENLRNMQQDACKNIFKLLKISLS